MSGQLQLTNVATTLTSFGKAMLKRRLGVTNRVCSMPASFVPEKQKH